MDSWLLKKKVVSYLTRVDNKNYKCISAASDYYGQVRYSYRYRDIGFDAEKKVMKHKADQMLIIIHLQKDSY